MFLKRFREQDKFDRRLIVFALLLAAVVFLSWNVFYSNKNLTPTALAQQDPLLERRVSQLEQRFYSLETQIRQLEFQSKLPSVQPRVSNNNEAELIELRTQVQLLQRRLAEVECAALRLDERTLSPATRETRRKSGAESGEPCRNNPNLPLSLSARP